MAFFLALRDQLIGGNANVEAQDTSPGAVEAAAAARNGLETIIAAVDRAGVDSPAAGAITRNQTAVLGTTVFATNKNSDASGLSDTTH